MSKKADALFETAGRTPLKAFQDGLTAQREEVNPAA